MTLDMYIFRALRLRRRHRNSPCCFFAHLKLSVFPFCVIPPYSAPSYAKTADLAGRRQQRSRTNRSCMHWNFAFPYVHRRAESAVMGCGSLWARHGMQESAELAGPWNSPCLRLFPRPRARHRVREFSSCSLAHGLTLWMG